MYLPKRYALSKNRPSSLRDACNYSNLFTAAAPVFLASLKDATVNAGIQLELSTAINAAAEPIEAAWQKDNKPIDTKAKGVTALCQHSQCTLKIDSCSLADAGEYSVTVKNPSGSVKSSAKITIIGFTICSFFHNFPQTYKVFFKILKN